MADLDPITRQEKIIAGEDIQPVTRLEHFLKNYGGVRVCMSIASHLMVKTKMHQQHK